MDRKRNVVARCEVCRQEALEEGSDREPEETVENYTHLCNCIIRIVGHVVEL